MIDNRITLVAALGTNRVIGVNNQLPWRLPADLKLFKTLTTGKTIIMGRKTFDSIGRPLPKRRNVILSRSGFKQGDLEVFTSIDQALDALPADDEIMVIGGGEIYRQCVPKASRLALSVVHTSIEGDAWFPVINSRQWRLFESRSFKADSSNQFDFTFMDFRRLPSDGSSVPDFLSQD
jgi:dihydrofolate reductase